MLNPLALSRGSNYLENALRLGMLADLAYRNDPLTGLVSFADHYRRLETFALNGTFGFVASDEHNLVVALRGSDEIIDWITNLKTAQVKGFGGMVHGGFADCLASTWKEIQTRVDALLDRGQTVWVTGHSLGGALATLVAAKLYEGGIEPYMTCTFGAPRVLNPQASAAYLPRLYRFINKGDLIPTVPPSLTLPWYRYQHAGSLVVVLDQERGAATHLDTHAIDLFSWGKWLLNPQTDWRKNVTQRLTDHAMGTYLSLIKAELGEDAVARLERESLPVVPLAGRIKPRRAA